MHVRTRVRQYFTKAITETFSDDDDIFQMGVVSSLFAIQLVMFVEEEFQITAAREDLSIDNFSSVAAVTSFVLGKMGRLEDPEPEHGHRAD